MHTDNKSYLIDLSQITLKYDFFCHLLHPTLLYAVERECNIKAWGKQKRETSLVFKPMQSLMGLCRKKLNFFRFTHLFQSDVTKEGLWQYHTAGIHLGFLGKLSGKFCFRNCKKCSLTQGQCKEEITLRRMHYSHHVPLQHKGVFHNYNEFLHSIFSQMLENWSSGNPGTFYWSK